MIAHYKGKDNKSNNKPFISSIEDELEDKNLQYQQVLINILEIISYDDLDSEEKFKEVIELCDKGLEI